MLTVPFPGILRDYFSVTPMTRQATLAGCRARSREARPVISIGWAIGADYRRRSGRRNCALVTFAMLQCLRMLPRRFHVFPEFGRSERLAGFSRAWPGSYLRVIVTSADAVFVVSAAAVALTVTVAGFGTEFGAL